MECVPSTLYGCVEYLEDDMVYYIWIDDQPFSHFNLVDPPNGPILPSTHIFLEIIHTNQDPLSLGTTINETSKEVKLKSSNKIVLTKIEQNSLDMQNMKIQQPSMGNLRKKPL